jgi:hypothetical protein
MGNISKSKKRDFLNQLIIIMEQNAQLITDKGFNARGRIDELNVELNEAVQAVATQKEMMAEAKSATKRANKALDLAYRNGSATVDLLSGLFGKSDNLLLEVKKLRK